MSNQLSGIIRGMSSANKRRHYVSHWLNRYPKLSLNDPDIFLNVAPIGSEGEFYMNYALQRPATQSSTFAPDFVANNSVDGVINGNPSVTAPNDQDPWWKVQLANRIWVSQVELTCLYCEWIACHTDITPLTQSFFF